MPTGRRLSKPYSYPDDIPSAVKDQSPGVQRAFISAFNAAYRQAIDDGKSEAEAEEAGRKAGWANVKRDYFRGSGGKYLPKKTREPLKGQYKKYDELPTDVQRLPTYAIKVWVTAYNAADDQKLTQRCDKAWAAVKKIYYHDNGSGQWHYKKRVHGRSRRMALALKKALESHEGKDAFQLDLMEASSMPETKKPMTAEQGGTGFFKIFLPLQQKEGRPIFKATTGSDGKVRLTGIGSSSTLDHDGEIMAPAFVKKMAKQAKGLPVFAEHEHHLLSTVGYIESARMVGDNAFEATTVLEPTFDPESQTGNKLVSEILMKLEHGTPLGYSIGGIVTAFDDVFYKEHGREIPTALDGTLHELTITAWRSNPDGAVALSKAISDLRGGSDEGHRTIQKFRHNSNTQEDEPDWGDVDKTKLPRIAHAVMGDPNKKTTWKYPHHHIANGGDLNDIGVFTTGTMYLNTGGVNAAWAALHGARSGERGPAEGIEHVQKHRVALGLEKVLLREGIDKMIECSLRFICEQDDVKADIAKTMKSLSPVAAALKSGRITGAKRRLLASVVARSMARVKADLLGRVIRDLYGIAD